MFFFHGSIFENLAFGDDTITLEKIKAGAKEIEVDQFIEQLPADMIMW
jgi:ABC-type bacteriocin/lantibiotic exporter with double-glycine peptidase domain